MAKKKKGDGEREFPPWVGGVVLSPVVFFFLIIAFPVTWVKLAGCSGTQQPLEASDGKVVLAEDVYANGGESTLYRVVRVQSIDAKTGAATKWVYKAHQWIGAAHGTGFLVGSDGVFGVSLTDGSVVLNEAKLAEKQPALRGHFRRGGDRGYLLDSGGRLLIDADDGRRWAVDSTFAVEELPSEVPGRTAPSVLSDRAEGLSWVGDRRKKLGGVDAMESLLMPQFVRGVGHEGALLTSHYAKVGEGGEGLMLSLVAADGKERWRYTSPHEGHERVVAAFQLGDVAVVQTYLEGYELVALELSTGKKLWAR